MFHFTVIDVPTEAGNNTGYGFMKEPRYGKGDRKERGMQQEMHI